jgi:dipeptidyl aminopeptidase/acylaminoacyl peptidase
LAFSSDRTGNWEIWRSDANGGNQIQLTSFGEAIVDGAYWSPDGKEIVFSALSKGNRDIYIMGADGGVVRRLTTDATDEGRPGFSRDGKWIYFRSNRTKREEIWKMPREGGAARQVTLDGGFDVRESMDGSRLFFTKSRLGSGLWTASATGGEVSPVPGLEQVRASYWALASNGIYWFAFGETTTLMRWDPATRKSAAVLTITAPMFASPPVLWVTADGKHAYWHQDDDRGADLVLIENFR